MLLHVKKGYDVFSFRRDSNYPANLYFQKCRWYGKDTLKEYKTTNGYFFHTIVSKDGWILSEGGPDVPYLNKKLEDLGGQTSVSGKITSSTIAAATGILRSLGMGHFVIKSPDDHVGLVTYNGGSLKTALFKMSDGQYVSVPNSPSCYRSGYDSTTDPVDSAINLAVTDRWGVNRRDIITYQVINVKDLVNYSTLVNVYASDSRGTPDNIVFEGKSISKYSLPRAPNKMFVGKAILKGHESIPQGLVECLLPLGVSNYSPTTSTSGKYIGVKFNYVRSNLHYDVTSFVKSGTWGHGKYTTVIETGTDNHGRKVYRVLNYFNNLFRHSDLVLKSSSGSTLYNSHVTKNGRQITEVIGGKLNPNLIFGGTVNYQLGMVNGQQLCKSATGIIRYWNHKSFYGKTLINAVPTYKNYKGIQKIIKYTVNSKTYYPNSNTISSNINSLYTRASTGKQIGLKTTGSVNGKQVVGSRTVAYTGKIYMDTRHDSKDIYNEYTSGNYSEYRRSTAKTLKRTIPLFESLIY